jgi:sigma-B regulation protein RsbU (phosphoserine phosphatase)
MELVDLSLNPRVPQYVSLLRDASRQTDPGEIQKIFASMLRNDKLVQGFISVSTRGLPPGKYKITRANLDDDLGIVTRNPWKEWATMPAYDGGFLGDVIKTPDPKLIRNMSITNDPVLGDKLARFGSCFVNPLFDDGEAINWSITFRLDREGYTLQDAEAFLMRGNIIGRMTKTLVVAKQVKELNAKLAQQLEQVAQIQRSLLPERTPDFPGLNIATSYLTSNEAGGDYYDFFEMGKDRLGVLIADVSGHGAGAATVMAMLQTMLRGFQERAKGPAAMLEHANRELTNKKVESNFVTAWMGVFDLDRGTLTYSNAGHPAPARRSIKGSIDLIEGAGSVPLGIIDEPGYGEATVPVSQGDTVVMYTDGITEAFSPPPERKMFGLGGLSTAMEHSEGEPLCVIEAVHEQLFDHTNSRDRDDDQTLVAVKVEA